MQTPPFTTRNRRTLLSLIWLGTLMLLPGLTQCEQRCFSVDENGVRTEFDCVTCIEEDANPCTKNSWQLVPGSTCDLSQQPLEADGTACDVGGSAGMCASGVCEPTLVLGAGSGSTTWHATAPVGGTSGAAGCSPFSTTLGAFIDFDVDITMNVVSDGAGNLTIGYDVVFDHSLVGAVLGAAEYGGLSLGASVSNATPAGVTNVADPAAVGQTLNMWIVGSQLQLSTTGGTITEESIVVTPTSAGTVNVNWAEQLNLTLTLAGQPLLEITESDCTFDVQGAGVDLPVVTP